MNRSEAKNLLDLIPVLQAYAAGKEVEYLTSKGNWIRVDYVAFSNTPDRYRIKSEPMVIYVNKYKRDDEYYVYFSEAEAEMAIDDGWSPEFIAKKFQEVIE